jgi:uncharacterized protein (TIGR02246 family)
MASKRTPLLLTLVGLGLTLGSLMVLQFGGLQAWGGPGSPADKAGAEASPPAAAPDDRPADRAAIREAKKEFVTAFEKGDAAAAATRMTAGAEMMAADGTTVHGRDAIQKAYADHFAKYPKHTVKVEPESLRFLSRDTALEEGRMTVTREKEEPGDYRYVILYVREDGQWKIAVLRNDESDQETLQDLGWLIGTATNILTPIDRDTFIWQPVNLTIDDEPAGNLPPVKVTRVKTK